MIEALSTGAGTIGCKACTGNGSRVFNNDICGSGMNATVVDPMHRTLNRKAKANTPKETKTPKSKKQPKQ